nr:MAG TPA_asm: glutaredoxin-like domain protein [Caudoviricetes sp.]
MGQINGNATVKLCKQFWRFGCINCMDGKKLL